MSNCDQNCEAVANLNDYAANLIEYSKRIDRWVNGGQTEFVDVGGVQTPTLRNLAMMIKALMGVHPDNKTIFINQDKEIYVKLSALIQNGGGLNIDSDGKLFVDVASMNTEVFQELMQTIRVPIWLTQSTDFYVNNSHPNKGNNIVEGRGTINMPFESIQACVDYVTSNFNMVNYTATIRIAAGTYYENLNLGQYSRVNGNIYIDTYVGHENQVNIMTEGITGIYCSGDPFLLQHLNIFFKPVWTSAVPQELRCIIVERGKMVLRACNLTMTDMSGLGASANYVMRLIGVYDNGTVIIPASLAGEVRTSFSFNYPSNKELYVLYAERGSNILTFATFLSQSSVTIDCYGSCTTFLALYNGNFGRGSGATYSTVFNGPGVIGKKFTIYRGSTCDTLGAGYDYFPGNQEGSVDSSTYSWYV